VAMSGAERQRRYRERHHDIAHVTIDVHVDVRDRLDRLSIHYDRCLTELVEKLAAAAEKHVEASLSGPGVAAVSVLAVRSELSNRSPLGMCSCRISRICRPACLGWRAMFR
jgi:hypothetical protein